MHQPSPLRSQLAQRFGHGPDQGAGKSAGQLPFDPGGIGQWSQYVKDRSCAKFSPRWHHMFGRRMVHRGHHKANPGLSQPTFHHRGADHDVDPKLTQSVRSPRFRRQVAVAVFGHWHACASHHKGGRGRDVQRPLAVAPGADDVHRPFGRVDRDTFGPHHRSGGGDFLHGFAPRAQGHQEPADLAGRGVTFEQNRERLFGLSAGQRPVGRRMDQGFKGVTHARTGTMFRKLRSRACPCSDAMLSGWNCTPWIGRVRCCRPMIVPSSKSAVTSRQSGRVPRSTTSE